MDNGLVTKKTNSLGWILGIGIVGLLGYFIGAQYGSPFIEKDEPPAEETQELVIYQTGNIESFENNLLIFRDQVTGNQFSVGVDNLTIYRVQNGDKFEPADSSALTTGAFVIVKNENQNLYIDIISQK